MGEDRVKREKRSRSRDRDRSRSRDRDSRRDRDRDERRRYKDIFFSEKISRLDSVARWWFRWYVGFLSDV